MIIADAGYPELSLGCMSINRAWRDDALGLILSNLNQPEHVLQHPIWTIRSMT
jgi:hypothetical protein